MNRVEWTQIAQSISQERAKFAKSWPPKDGYMADARDVHDRKLMYYATLDGFDRATRALCHALRSRSSRFDGERFLRIAGLPDKAA